MHGNYQQLAEYAKLTDDKKWNNFLLNIAADFNSKASRKKRKKSKQHIALSKLKIKIVYTTNYDRHIEGAFEDSGIKVKSIVSIKDFLKEDKERYEMEVIKFHGCLTEPKSIILTEKQYYERMELEDALDQRLRSDTLSNSFLFIGYSFDDPNIRYIWYKINAQKIKYHSSSSGSDFRPSYIATFGMNEIQARILEEFNIKVIALNPINKEEQISQLLTNII